MEFHISNEKYNKLLKDMYDVVNEHVYGFMEYGQHIEIWLAFESLLNDLTDNQMRDKMYGLSAELFEKLDNFRIGLNALQERIDISFSQEDIIHALNEILDERVSDALRSNNIIIDYPNDE